MNLQYNLNILYKMNYIKKSFSYIAFTELRHIRLNSITIKYTVAQN